MSAGKEDKRARDPAASCFTSTAFLMISTRLSLAFFLPLSNLRERGVFGFPGAGTGVKWNRNAYKAQNA